jgi:hypothetical protein
MLHCAAILFALLAPSALAFAGCGGDESGGSGEDPAQRQELTAGERDLVREDERAIQSYCVQFALYAAGQRKSPPASREQRALAAVDDLIGLARDKAFARVERGVNLRLAISDLAENLEGSNCDPRIVAGLNQGLSELPQR